MIRGPKVKMTLSRYTAVSDGGGSSTKTWTDVATIKGVLTFIWADEQVRADRESLQNRYQFWCKYKSSYAITSKDEMTLEGTDQRYRVVYADNVLEKNKIYKIDLVQTR